MSYHVLVTVPVYWPWHAPAEINQGGHIGVLTGMWVFQIITLYRATKSAKSQAKIRFAFHFVERNKRKRFRLLNFPRAAILDIMTSLLCPVVSNKRTSVFQPFQIFFLELFFGGVLLLRRCCLPSYLRGFWIHRRLAVYAAGLLLPKQDYFEGCLAMPRVLWTPRVYREARLE